MKKKFSNKIKLYILKIIFDNSDKKKVVTYSSDLAFKVSKKYIVSEQKLNEYLIELQGDNLIDFVATNGKKGYYYTITLTIKGEFALRKQRGKTGDIVVSIFVYMIIIGLLLLFIYSLKQIFGG